ncbi:conserved hypothetical protein [Arthrobacter sp. Hiyo8]|uniref:hypothetical protein n=1 Tax=Arthrobacter sp. Hiyo1 TaxID=1588020 RepID=UPI000683B0DF|nr:hypothetical protein [Arthrobacter sp. Hiyo1]BAS11829.1 conserved hypothetical protein [Arthrobacter sp. Hiyo8]GAP61317.1 conserved hypothetical protein [Arthrobacter sp. Hiyo1]
MGATLRPTVYKQTRILFVGSDLSELLRQRRDAYADDLAEWDPDDILSAPGDVASELGYRHRIDCPVLLRDEMFQGRPVDRKVNLGPEFRPEDIRRQVKVYRATIPFLGEKEVFLRRPGRSDLNPPAANLDRASHTLTVEYEQPAGNAPEAETISNDLLAQIDQIEKWLSWSKEAIDQHNAQMADVAAVERRRTEVLAERKLQDAIGIPLQRQADADAYKVPLERKTVRVRPKAAKPFEPEPALDDADYEDAMRVLESARNALERTPELAASFTEERIRDLLLIFLNATFKGTAAGEMFNKQGKTDILIRERDRNVFIAECKIWSGPKTIEAALEQLLDRYTTWRDARVSLLLFVRGGNPTAIAEKAVQTIIAHERCLKTARAGGPGERSDFIFHAVNDPVREIKLAFLPFFLPVKADSGKEI